MKKDDEKLLEMIYSLFNILKKKKIKHLILRNIQREE